MSEGAWIPTINQALSIPELIKILKDSFRECEYDEVQKILMDREKSMKMEIENLVRDRDLIKEEARLLERTESLAELEKLKLEEKLQRSERKCEELKRQNLEATQTVDELRLKKMESDKAAELYKSSLENLKPKIMKVEAELADFLKVTVEDFSKLVDITDTSAAAQGQNVGMQDFLESVKDSLGNGNTNADAEDVVVVSPGMRSTANSNRNGDIRLPKKGGSYSVHSCKKEDGANTVHASPGSQSPCNSPSVECNVTALDNEGEEPQVSGPHASAMRSDGGVPVIGKSKFVKKCSSTTKCSSSVAKDVIEILDSDDETNPGDTTYISDTSSGQTNKRNRTDCKGDSPTNLITKRKRRLFISDKEDNVPTGLLHSTPPPGSFSSLSRHEEKPERPCVSQTKVNVVNDVDSTDSDDSCSDAYMEKLVATIQRKRNQQNTTTTL